MKNNVMFKLLDLKYVLNQIAMDKILYLEDIKKINNETIITRRGNTINGNCYRLLVLFAELENDKEFINDFNNKKLYQNEINKRYSILSKKLHKLFNEKYDINLLQII